MKLALNEAKKSLKYGEVPVGCIIVYKNKVIAKGFNMKERKKCVLYHAEMIAIEKASKKLNNWRLNDCEMYVTLKPCPMCSSAIKQSRIGKVYYGTDNKNNSISTLILNDIDINNKVKIEGNILFDECRKIIQNFFKYKRK